MKEKFHVKVVVEIHKQILLSKEENQSFYNDAMAKFELQKFVLYYKTVDCKFRRTLWFPLCHTLKGPCILCIDRFIRNKNRLRTKSVVDDDSVLKTDIAKANKIIHNYV